MHASWTPGHPGRHIEPGAGNADSFSLVMSAPSQRYKGVECTVEQKLNQHKRQGQQYQYPQPTEQDHHRHRRDNKTDERTEQPPCHGPAPVRLCHASKVCFHIDAGPLEVINKDIEAAASQTDQMDRDILVLV